MSALKEEPDCPKCGTPMDTTREPPFCCEGDEEELVSLRASLLSSQDALAEQVAESARLAARIAELEAEIEKRDRCTAQANADAESYVGKRGESFVVVGKGFLKMLEAELAAMREALVREFVNQSAERTWCILCRTERLADRPAASTHPHASTCVLDTDAGAELLARHEAELLRVAKMAWEAAATAERDDILDEMVGAGEIIPPAAERLKWSHAVVEPTDLEAIIKAAREADRG